MSASTPPPDPLTALTAQAQKAYSLKNYPEAVSLFAQACETQARLHGSEDDPRNAHLLYLYGKALYQVAISKSDILGTAADAGRKQISAEAAVGAKALSKDLDVAKKGKVIHFQGDENWDDTDAEDDGDEQAGAEGDTDNDGGGSGDDDEDDMAAAWEVLDLARVLFHKALDAAWTPSTPVTALTAALPPPSEAAEQQNEPSAAAAGPDPKAPLTPAQRTSLLTQLSDVYDLLGEISLESENFPQSITDLRSSLTLKLALFPTHHKLVSEAHYKLSLALEFASAMEGVSDSDSAKGRAEAAEQMELAVRSVRERITVEEESLARKHNGKGKGKATEAEEDAAEKSLLDAREIVAELEQRLDDLRAPVPSDERESAAPMISGLLKSVLGETQAEQKRRLQEVIEGAKDVSGLVRKKEKKAAAEVAVGGAAPTPAERAKRKLEDVEMEDVKGRVVAVGTGGADLEAGAKKPKVEESLDVEERAGGSAAL
ncbi:hypothetical protein EV426DRAFT_605188 [Tirmania nivea]|nr:hypothetical protein EV426DRAFT_605188 [Tirmania nivea]